MYARDITRRFEKTDGGIAMKAPDKIYVKEFDEGINQMWSRIKATETMANAQHEYIRKDALLEWAKAMKRICKAAEPIEKAYQTMIDKLNEM